MEVTSEADVVTADCGPIPNWAFTHNKALSIHSGQEDVPKRDTAVPSSEDLGGPLPTQSALLQAGGQAGVSSRMPGVPEKKWVFFPLTGACADRSSWKP